MSSCIVIVVCCLLKLVNPCLPTIRLFSKSNGSFIISIHFSQWFVYILNPFLPMVWFVYLSQSIFATGFVYLNPCLPTVRFFFISIHFNQRFVYFLNPFLSTVRFLAHLAKGHVSFCHHLSSVIRRKLSHLNLLLWNPWTKLNQTWQRWSLGGSLSKFCPTNPPSIQDGCCY